MKTLSKEKSYTCVKTLSVQHRLKCEHTFALRTPVIVFTAAAVVSEERWECCPGFEAAEVSWEWTFLWWNLPLVPLWTWFSPAVLERWASTLNSSNELNFYMKPFKNGFNVMSEKEWEFQDVYLLWARITQQRTQLCRGWGRERIFRWDVLKLRCLWTVILGTGQWTDGQICVEAKD